MKKLLALALVLSLFLLPLSASALDKEEFRKILDLVPEMTMTQTSRIYLAAKEALIEKYSMNLNPSPEKYLSGLSFDELIALREQLNLAIWNCQEWQEVTIPTGTWIVGVDIPAGHWSIRTSGKLSILNISAFDHADAAGKSAEGASFFWIQTICSPDYAEITDFDFSTVADINLQNGWYFKCEGTVIFSPYSGHADFGFQ